MDRTDYAGRNRAQAPAVPSGCSDLVPARLDLLLTSRGPSNEVPAILGPRPRARSSSSATGSRDSCRGGELGHSLSARVQLFAGHEMNFRMVNDGQENQMWRLWATLALPTAVASSAYGTLRSPPATSWEGSSFSIVALAATSFPAYGATTPRVHDEVRTVSALGQPVPDHKEVLLLGRGVPGKQNQEISRPARRLQSSSRSS